MAEKYSSTNLIPYEKIYDDFTIQNVGYLGAKHSFVKVVKITGFDIRNLSDDEADRAINEIDAAMQLVESAQSWIKTEASLDLSENRKYLESRLKAIQNEEDFTLNQKGARIKILDEMIGKFNEEDEGNHFNSGELSSDQLKKEFYISLYNTNFKSLCADVETLSQHFRAAGLGAESCSAFEIVNLMKHLLDPTPDNFTAEEVEEYKDKLDELLSYRKVDFNAADYKTELVYEDGETQPIYTNVSTLREMPTYPYRAWLFGMMDLPMTSVIMNISKTNEKRFNAELNKTKLTMQTNLISTSVKDTTGQTRQQAEIEVLEDVINDFAAGKEKFIHIDIQLITRAFSEKELHAALADNAKAAKENEFELDNLVFHQLEGYESTLLKEIDPLALPYGRDTTTYTVASAFPFISTNILDPEGVYFARNTLGEPLIVDFFKNLKKDKFGNTDPTRLNANMFVMAKSGSGKSSALKTLLLEQAAIGNRIYVFDPMGEYAFISQDLHGISIDASAGGLNPLQPMATGDTDDKSVSVKEHNEKIIQDHVRFLSSWWMVLYPDADSFTTTKFRWLVSEMYQDWIKKHKKFTTTRIEDMKPTDFPIFDDFIAYAKKIKGEEKMQGRDLTKEVLFFVEGDFTGTGAYSNLYNHYSTLDVQGNKAVQFDLHSLLDHNNNRVIQAQILLMTEYIKAEIKNVALNSTDNTIVCIDEAHLLIDEKNPVALDFIAQLVKMIRKQRGGVWLATQNPADFFGSDAVRKKTTAIINNSQYAWIGHLTSDDLEEVSSMYASDGGFTDAQKQFIANAGKGQALFLTTGKSRQNIQMQHLALTKAKGFA